MDVICSIYFIIIMCRSENIKKQNKLFFELFIISTTTLDEHGRNNCSGPAGYIRFEGSSPLHCHRV